MERVYKTTAVDGSLLGANQKARNDLSNFNEMIGKVLASRCPNGETMASYQATQSDLQEKVRLSNAEIRAHIPDAIVCVQNGWYWTMEVSRDWFIVVLQDDSIPDESLLKAGFDRVQ